MLRRVRLVSLAAQGFLAGVTHDALQVHKRRKQASAWRQKELGYNAKDQRLVLAAEDVAEALKEVPGVIAWTLHARSREVLHPCDQGGRLCRRCGCAELSDDGTPDLVPVSAARCECGAAAVLCQQPEAIRHSHLPPPARTSSSQALAPLMRLAAGTAQLQSLGLAPWQPMLPSSSCRRCSAAGGSRRGVSRPAWRPVVTPSLHSSSKAPSQQLWARPQCAARRSVRRRSGLSVSAHAVDAAALPVPAGKPGRLRSLLSSSYDKGAQTLDSSARRPSVLTRSALPMPSAVK